MPCGPAIAGPQTTTCFTPVKMAQCYAAPMSEDHLSGITGLLNAAHSGDIDAQNSAYALVYEELKRCARRQRVSADGSLTPTGLVNELFLRLSTQRALRVESRLHFFSLAARAMRQIVIDRARRRASLKRGAGVESLSSDGSAKASDFSAEQALDLDAALSKLSAKDERLARIVEWHFFAGLTFKEIGAELNRHERSVLRECELARAAVQELMR